MTEKNTKQRKVRDGIEHPSTIAVTQTIGNRHSYNSYKKLKRKMVLIKRKENSKRKSPFEKSKRDIKDSKRALKIRGIWVWKRAWTAQTCAEFLVCLVP